MSRGAIVSLQIENNSSPASSFSTKKPLAGLLLHLDTGEIAEVQIAKDTARVIQNHQESFLDLDETSARELLIQYDQEACWIKLLGLLKRRDYACSDIKKKLLGAGFQEVSVKESIQRALNHKFLNDQRFADAYVRSKISSGWGRSKIERELKLKGIDIDLVSEETSELLSEEEEYLRALEILKRKQLPKTNIEQKFIRFLVGRGFAYAISVRATKCYLDTISSEFEPYKV